jgi:hypothetical protein
MVQQYRHLKMLKRAMQAYDPGGISATKAGKCAVLCPACPHPGLNLDPDWKSQPPERQYVHQFYFSPFSQSSIDILTASSLPSTPTSISNTKCIK